MIKAILLSLLLVAPAWAHDKEWSLRDSNPDAKAVVTKNDHGYHGHIEGKIDVPYHAGTVWWRFYNNPRECATHPCTKDDAANPWVRAAVFWAGGYTTDENGYAKVDLPFVGVGTCRMNRTTKGREVQRTPWCLEGHHKEVEVELVVRSHGAIAWDRIWQVEQKTTHNGGCKPACKDVMTFTFWGE